MREVSEVGFLLELALPLELEQAPRALLRLYHDRHESQRDETFLLRILVHDALQGRGQRVGSVVINLNGFINKLECRKRKLTSTLLLKSAVTALASPS